MNPSQAIIEGSLRLALKLPGDVVEQLAQVVSAHPGSEARSRIADGIPHPHYRSLCFDFLEHWRTQAPAVSASEVAIALRTSSCSQRSREADPSVEIVWTGPRSEATSFRRTEQAILQVLNSAQSRILLVSYAVYNVPRVAEALIRAADRGVRITIIVESPDRLEGQNTYSTLKALGGDVAACATVYLWPRDKRKQAEDGRFGILHVKCVVADGRIMFLSSANLTEYAFSLNMELGLLITGGEQPLRVEDHFDRLIERGILTRP
jgi:phosphatidylserine/phosphatidylglycerophosphate/cardiolipin synthase-like enzyme